MLWQDAMNQEILVWHEVRCLRPGTYSLTAPATMEGMHEIMVYDVAHRVGHYDKNCSFSLMEQTVTTLVTSA
jgi:hypothetical protein